MFKETKELGSVELRSWRVNILCF